MPRTLGGRTVLVALQQLAEVCTRRQPAAGDVVEACTLIRGALDAADAYVIRAGDPHFVRIGCDCAPSEYEIKQKGYWLVWRDLASAQSAVACVFDVNDRLVSGGAALREDQPATHVATILASDEANSDLLVVHGPWARGLTTGQVQWLHAARAILSPLVSAVADADRRSRQREQLEALANVTDAFNRAMDSEHFLTAIATALAKSAGIDWVTIAAYDDDGTSVIDRAMNVARHSDTRIASAFRGPPGSQRSSAMTVGVELAKRDGCLLVSDVFAEGLEDRPDLGSIREDLPQLQRYWQRAHVLSVALFPIVFQGSALGHVWFSSATARAWNAPEVEFLRALVAQAATTVKGLRLFTQLDKSRQELRASEERFRSLVQNASDMITVVGPYGTITYQSPSSRHLLGYPPEAVVGRPFADFLHPDDAAYTLEAMAGGSSTSRPGMLVSELRMCHRDGSWRQVECIGADQRDNPSIDGFVLNIRDISERKRLERQLRYQAYHDPLTGLVNRREFGDRLTEALHEPGTADQLAVLFLDLDNFKEINDSLGHEAGDRVLLEVARRLSACVRPGDTVARLGGDEFAILLRRLDDPQRAELVATRLLEHIQLPMCIEDREVVIGASVGIARGGGPGWPDRDGLLRAADVAMYAAKGEGKSCYRQFEPSMLTAIVERHDLAAELRVGLSRSEFELHYQPLVELSSGNLWGLEALVRWHHPRHGLMGPADFIPIAEESGAMLPLGQWVLEQACLQAASWLKEHPAPGGRTLSVNVSMRQLQQASFVANLQRAIDAAGLPATSLILEITESAMVQDSAEILGRLRRLRALGVRIALDDFATGYSSLSYLRELPVDLLKIDRRFVADVGEVEPQRELLPVILELGRTLGIRVVAEGIERQQQLDRLHELGCELGQGYLLGRPQPAAMAAALVAGDAGRRRLQRAA